MRTRLPLLLALALGPLALGASVAPEASASIATATTLEGLVVNAHVVALAEPVESASQWEGGRIVTYTKLHLVERLGGDAPEDVWVKTLGGTVGELGQAVEGEPIFAKSTRTLLFLRRVTDPTHADVHMVVSRGQGAYPLVKDKARWVVRTTPQLGTVLPVQGKASQVAAIHKLAGRAFDDVAIEVRALWTQVHATKK